MSGLRIIPVVVFMLMAHFVSADNVDLDHVLNRFSNMEEDIVRLTQRVNDLEMKDVSQTKQILQLEKELSLLTIQNSDLQLQHEESRETIRNLETSITQCVRKSDMDGMNQNGLNRNSRGQYNDTQYKGVDPSDAGQRLRAKERGHAIKVGEPNIETPLPPRPRNVRTIAEGGPYIAFTAYVSPHDYGPLGAGQIIVFGNVLTNVGNAYHAHSGIFTAPVDGLYVFSVTIAGVSHKLGASYVAIHVNSGDVCSIWTANTDQSSQMVILNLHQNDDVYATNSVASDVILGATYSSFSGFLLYPSE